MRNQPHVTAEIRFVGHGYQLEIWDYTHPAGVKRFTICSDFVDSGPSICDRAQQATGAIISALKSTESINPPPKAKNE